MALKNYFQLFVSLSHAITSTLESQEMISRCLRELVQGMRCEAASVFLVSEKTGQIELFALSGNDHKLTNVKLNRMEGIVGWVIENKQAILVPDVNRDTRFSKRIDHISHFVTHSLLAAPLIHLGEVIGALEILNPLEEEFQSDDLLFCEAVAAQLATLVRNLDLFSETEELLHQLQNLDKMKSSFISMASHELFTPLTKVKIQIQLLSDGLEGPLTPEQKKRISQINANVDQLTHIARDLTNMNLLESKTSQIEKFNDNLNAVLLGTIEETTLLCKKRQLEFITHLAGNLPKFSFDRRLVAIMVRNLLLNAIRFTPDKGQITLSTRCLGPDIEIEVKDTGIGIDPKDHQAIFQPLFEVNDTSYHHSGTIEFKSGGLGLGLPIARRIALAHDGKIWVESELNKGTQFFVRLPIVDVQSK